MNPMQADRGFTTAAGMYVHEAGTPGAPAVVFLHGAGASGRMWRDHLARLGDRYHCLAPDFPGFGRSNQVPSVSQDEATALAVELIRTRVPGRKASIVGLSWGGGIAHLLLAGHTELVDHAVIDGAGVLAARGGRLLMFGIGALAPFLHTRPVIALLSDMIGMDDVGRADLRASSRRAFRRAFADGSKPAVSPAELASPCPTLFVAGEKETEIRPSNAAMAALMPNAAARFAPGVPHGWLARRMDLHVRMVEAWLAGADLPAELVPELPDPAAEARLRRELAGG
jgi:pimeloyl-ACP methyl ester carboxylesterase